MVFDHNQLKIEQVHSLSFQMIRSEELNHLKEQYVNLFHFHIELLILNLNTHKKFDHANEKSAILYRNGVSLLIVPSDDSIPQT